MAVGGDKETETMCCCGAKKGRAAFHLRSSESDRRLRQRAAVTSCCVATESAGHPCPSRWEVTIPASDSSPGSSDDCCTVVYHPPTGWSAQLHTICMQMQNIMEMVQLISVFVCV